MRHQRLLRFLFFLPLRLGVFLYAVLTARAEDLNRNSPLHILVSILLFLAPLVEDRTLMVPWLMVYGAEFVYLFPWDCCGDLCSSWNYLREFILGYGLLVVSSYYLLLKDVEENGAVDLGVHWVPGFGNDGTITTRTTYTSGVAAGNGEEVVETDIETDVEVNVDVDDSGGGVDGSARGSRGSQGGYGVGCEDFNNELPPVSVASQHHTTRTSLTTQPRTLVSAQCAMERASEAAAPDPCVPPPLPDYCFENKSEKTSSRATAYRYGAKSSKRASAARSGRRTSCLQEETVDETIDEEGEELRPIDCPPCPPCPGSHTSRRATGQMTQRASGQMTQVNQGSVRATNRQTGSRAVSQRMTQRKVTRQGKFADVCKDFRRASGADPGIVFCPVERRMARCYPMPRHGGGGSRESGEASVFKTVCFVAGKGVKVFLGAVAYILDNAFDTGDYQEALYSSSLTSSAPVRRSRGIFNR